MPEALKPSSSPSLYHSLKTNLFKCPKYNFTGCIFNLFKNKVLFIYGAEIVYISSVTCITVHSQASLSLPFIRVYLHTENLNARGSAVQVSPQMPAKVATVFYH